MKLFKICLVIFLLINVGCLDSGDTSYTDAESEDAAGIINAEISDADIDNPEAGTFADNESSLAIFMDMDDLSASGCGVPPPVRGKKIIRVNGVFRTFFVDVPDNYDPNRLYPLVFAFHGMGFNGNSFRLYCGLSEVMGEDAIVVYPDAVGDQLAWELKDSQDLLFFDAMLDKLLNRLCIDHTRIFATGHSKGASFCNTLGCYRGDVLRAIAPVEGRSVAFRDGDTCIGQVAVWMAHGKNDLIVPFSIGKLSRDYWMDTNGCSNRSISVYPDECVEYSGCDKEYPVQWCPHRKGHRWPGFAAEAISDFFLSF